MPKPKPSTFRQLQDLLMVSYADKTKAWERKVERLSKKLAEEKPRAK